MLFSLRVRLLSFCFHLVSFCRHYAFMLNLQSLFCTDNIHIYIYLDILGPEFYNSGSRLLIWLHFADFGGATNYI